MASVFEPAAPVIVSAEPVTFFGQHGVHINGTEDLSGLPNGYTMRIKVFDLTLGYTLTREPVLVNSDGTWEMTGGPCYTGDLAAAYALASDDSGSSPPAATGTTPFPLP